VPIWDAVFADAIDTDSYRSGITSATVPVKVPPVRALGIGADDPLTGAPSPPEVERVDR
jgi:hypothetical protein